jgi:thioredoxin-like negative regulator of GroEL
VGTTSEPGVIQAYQITGMPSTLFITPDGRIVRKWTGLLTEEKLTELVQELLQESGGA